MAKVRRLEGPICSQPPPEVRVLPTRHPDPPDSRNSKHGSESELMGQPPPKVRVLPTRHPLPPDGAEEKVGEEAASLGRRRGEGGKGKGKSMAKEPGTKPAVQTGELRASQLSIGATANEAEAAPEGRDHAGHSASSRQEDQQSRSGEGCCFLSFPCSPTVSFVGKVECTASPPASQALPGRTGETGCCLASGSWNGASHDTIATSSTYVGTR